MKRARQASLRLRGQHARSLREGLEGGRRRDDDGQREDDRDASRAQAGTSCGHRRRHRGGRPLARSHRPAPSSMPRTSMPAGAHCFTDCAGTIVIRRSIPTKSSPNRCAARTPWRKVEPRVILGDARRAHGGLAERQKQAATDERAEKDPSGEADVPADLGTDEGVVRSRDVGRRPALARCRACASPRASRTSRRRRLRIGERRARTHAEAEAVRAHVTREGVHAASRSRRAARRSRAGVARSPARSAGAGSPPARRRRSRASMRARAQRDESDSHQWHPPRPESRTTRSTSMSSQS